MSAAPELENASKTGDNYNVTLKLNTSQLGNNVTEREEREEREEYEEQIRMQRRQQREREERAEQMRLEQFRTERLLAEREERLRLQKLKADIQREEQKEQMKLETLRLQRLREEEEERMRLDQVRKARMLEEQEEQEEYRRLEQVRADRLREQKEELEEQRRLEMIRAERMRAEQAEHEEFIRLERLRQERILEEQRLKMTSPINPLSPRYVASAQLQEAAPIERISFTNYHGPHEGVVARSSSHREQTGTHIVTDIGSKKAGMPAAAAPVPSNGEAPRFTMCIDQTMKMDYVPPGEVTEPADTYRHKPVDEMIVPKQVNNRSGPAPPQPQQVEEMLTTSHTQHNGWADPDDSEEDEDSEYTVEEETVTTSYPNVVRGSILIKNSIDTTGAPKVFDVVDGESENDEDPLCEDNTNMFRRDYFTEKENPMYSSDPDLSQAAKHQPQFTRVFTQSSTTTRANGHAQDNDSDIVIPVSRGKCI